MPGTLSHSPADVLRKLLVSLSLGSYPANPSGSWPIYASGEPDEPDSAITVYDTTGVTNGRTAPDMEMHEYHGVQIRIRAAAHTAGYAKSRATAIALDGIQDRTVSIGSTTYIVQVVNRTGDVLSLGKEDGKRSVFTVNALVMVRQR